MIARSPIAGNGQGEAERAVLVGIDGQPLTVAVCSRLTVAQQHDDGKVRKSLALKSDNAAYRIRALIAERNRWRIAVGESEGRETAAQPECQQQHNTSGQRRKQHVRQKPGSS